MRRYFPLKPKSVKTPPAKYRWEPYRPAEVVQQSISLAPTCDDKLQALLDLQDLLDFQSYHFRQAGADRVEVTHDDKTPGNYLFTITYPERHASKVPTRISDKNP